MTKPIFMYEHIALLTKQGLSPEEIAAKLEHPVHAIQLGLKQAQRMGAC